MAAGGTGISALVAYDWTEYTKVPYYWAGALVGICEGVVVFGISPLAIQLSELRNDEKWASFLQTFFLPQLRGRDEWAAKDVKKSAKPGSVDILCLPAVVEGDTYYDSVQDFDDAQSHASSKTAGETFEDPDPSFDGDGMDTGELAEKEQQKRVPLRRRMLQGLRAIPNPFRRNKKQPASQPTS